MTWIGVFGLGEAGSAIAGDLAAAGADVYAYDPADVPTPPGVIRHDNPDAVVDPVSQAPPVSGVPAGRDDPKAAVGRAAVVLGITAAEDAAAALEQALDAIPKDAIYADLSTSAPRLKEQLAERAAEAGIGFVDVALMAPVPGKGLKTPALASGPAAEAFIDTMAPLGMPVEWAGEQPGLAATRKLLRSVVMKGLAALVIEGMQAADAAGLRDETWDNVVAQLTAADETFIQRLVDGTTLHGRRRLHEMEAAAELLEDLGVDPAMTRATRALLKRVAMD